MLKNRRLNLQQKSCFYSSNMLNINMLNPTKKSSDFCADVEQERKILPISQQKIGIT